MARKDFDVKVNHRVDDVLDASARRGLNLAAEHVRGEAQKTAPIEEGTLERSAFVSTDESSLKAAISFDTPYAIAQHENLHYRHDPGRTAKYLENALNGNTAEIRSIIARTIAGEL